MDFRVELSAQAQHDIGSIHDWLRSQSAGDTGERWFVALRTAIASLTQLPSRCPLAPESQDSSTEVRSSCTAAGRMCIASCLRSKVTSFRFCTSDMAADGRSHVPEHWHCALGHYQASPKCLHDEGGIARIRVDGSERNGAR